MNKPAVIAADYFNFEYKKGLKVCRLTFEVPYEHAKLVRDVLGDPPLPGEQVRVAIARLVESSGRISGPTENVPEVAHVLCQEAARALNKPEFRMWLCNHYQEQWNRNEADKPAGEVADATLKDILGIESKCDLDKYEMKGKRWSALKTDFDFRNQVR